MTAAAVFPFALRWAGLSMVVLALMDAHTSLRQRRTHRRVRAGFTSAAAGTVARAYNGLPSSRKLRQRLRAATFAIDPAGFRAAQVMIGMPTALMLAVLTGSVLAGVSLASLTVRIGGAALLRQRRDRRQGLLEEFTATLAQSLATELASGASPEDILTTARGERYARKLPGAEVLGHALARIRVGDAAAQALRSAAEAEIPGPGASRLAELATTLELVVARGAGTAPLACLARAIEAERQSRRDVSAVLAEARMAAGAVPVLTVVMGAMLVATSPAAGAAALSLPVAPVIALAAGIALGATALARRMTSARPAR
jgi:Flp pilus assembly protein TadB